MDGYGHTLRPRARVEPGPGQESVWDYPRPPRLEAFDGEVQVVFNGATIAQTRAAKRVLETSHPPVYYIPPGDVRMDLLKPVARSSWCEWKGRAVYFDVQVGEREVPAAAWSYPEPMSAFEPIADHIAFYAAPMDACLVDGETVRAQGGGFYGGWITSSVVGPFKGEF